MSSRENISEGRRRVRRIAKWIGTLLSVFIIATWLVTVPAFTNKQLSILRISPGGSIALVDGTVQITSSPFDPRRPTLCATNWNEGIGYLGERVPFGLGLPVISRSITKISYCTIPLWLPLFLVAFPTLLLWDRDRGYIFHGHCQNCNYNLTGNTS